MIRSGKAFVGKGSQLDTSQFVLRSLLVLPVLRAPYMQRRRPDVGEEMLQLTV